MQGYREVIESAVDALRPDLNLTVDEWSDRFMIIPKSSGSNEYGPYRTDRTPHARKIMQALSDDHPAKRVVAKVASQMFKTQIAMNWLACSIHQSPANFLLLMPTGKLHKRIAARIDKIVAAVHEITPLVAKPNSRDAQNNMDTKEYKGGALFLATAGAAANLSEVPARRVAFDEVDRAVGNVDGEGDPVKLGESRQTTFQSNRKGYYYSSPTIEGESRIDELFNQGTKRRALAECVHCGHELDLLFDNLVTLDDGAVVYPCDKCGVMHHEADKTAMFKRGLWSEPLGGDGQTESFTASAMFLPYGWLSWAELTYEYTAASEALERGIEELMIVFYNTRLAQCWERKKEQPKYDALMSRAEPYPLGTVPMGGVVLTAAVDTQDNRFEMKVVAWAEGFECWVVDYKVIYGSPSDESFWDQLDRLLKVKYRHESGVELGIERVLIDSGGHHTQDVYNFTRTKTRRGIFSIRGESVANKEILSRQSKPDTNYRGKKRKKGVLLWLIGTDRAKDYLLTRWDKVEGAGAIHFSHELEEDYYKQLTAEFRTTVIKRGRAVSVWDKKEGDRNEALDVMVYNLAAAHLLGIGFWTRKDWSSKRRKFNVIEGIAAEVKEETPQPEVEIKEKEHEKPRRIKKLPRRIKGNSSFMI